LSKDSGEFWHYNVYLTGSDYQASYLNLLAEFGGSSFEFTPEYKGVYYFVFQPESNLGRYGEPLNVKITIE
jgi:hypothetical protein